MRRVGNFRERSDINVFSQGILSDVSAGYIVPLVGLSQSVGDVFRG